MIQRNLRQTCAIWIYFPLEINVRWMIAFKSFMTWGFISGESSISRLSIWTLDSWILKWGLLAFDGRLRRKTLSLVNFRRWSSISSLIDSPRILLVIQSLRLSLKSIRIKFTSLNINYKPFKRLYIDLWKTETYILFGV